MDPRALPVREHGAYQRGAALNRRASSHALRHSVPCAVGEDRRVSHTACLRSATSARGSLIARRPDPASNVVTSLGPFFALGARRSRELLRPDPTTARSSIQFAPRVGSTQWAICGVHVEIRANRP
jgi:hypothetical protein